MYPRHRFLTTRAVFTSPGVETLISCTLLSFGMRGWMDHAFLLVGTAFVIESGWITPYMARVHEYVDGRG